MTTLHLLSQSPFASPLDSTLRLLGVRDGLLLCGDACHALQPGSAPLELLEHLPASIALHVLAEDLEARNLAAPERVQVLDYPGFVALCTRYDKVNGWL
ncbi:sulfurtransferase complex subunit TusB [Azotobacter chroococcum]|uniref:Sulfurtransferase complex subunit TusB n=1 Tax=Azotobacter chroococcum TaxID=353 RepID=A0AA44C5D1_9GAMM|nr:sulfurtransferase complex subunit TusB [Azotobacter chroococcum]NHN76310.1 sulfurtransferase complex subunit TusB [Azotobacter chroococcum]TBW07663.1 sulfurtransferase complex subunit TusB [Azotobacter chroococcum subsp. isscasi]